jgi:hypothetical protein
VPVERHRGDSAGAIEKKAPLTAEPEKPVEGKRRVVASTAPDKPAASNAEDDILVVASKIRKYINDKSGMNVSASLYEALSEKLRGLCEMAMESARADGRKTVMDRDVT